MLGVIVASALAIAASYLSLIPGGAAPGWAPWGLAIGTSVLCSALTALGARRPDRHWGAFAVPALVIGSVMAAGFAAALILPAEHAASPLVLGLPLRTAIVVYGVGVLPALVLPLFYARTFDTLVLSEADLERVLVEARQAREAAARGQRP